MSCSPSEWSRAYNNRLLVPDFLSILELWEERSNAARSTLHGRWDVPYGSDRLHTLDVVPAARGPLHGPEGSPILVFIHGGYWRMLDKSAQTFLAPPWVSLGASVVIPNYRLAPAVTIGEIIQDTEAAVSWVWRNAASWGGDRRRIVVAGHSAGGHLAANLLTTQWPRLAKDLPADLCTKALAISGLFDLETLAHCEWLQPDLQLDAQRVAAWSPARQILPAGRALTVAVGGQESPAFAWQADQLRQRWGAGVSATVEAAGRNHFDVLFDVQAPETPLGQALGRLLAEAERGPGD